MSGFRIPLAIPDLSGNEEAYVVEAIRSSWIASQGAFVDRFQAEFAAATGAGYALAVCNGTVALHLAMLALGIGPDDEVLVPSLTFVATANAVRYVGARPVFVDVDPRTWCIDVVDAARKIGDRTRAIIPVHLYGHPADMDAINALATEHGLSVVEDAAEAFGALYKGRPVGGLGDIGTFSFYGNKILTSGEGGAVLVNDASLHDRLALLRGQGMNPGRRYYFEIVGHNFRLTNVACALLCAQLERGDALLARRRAIFALYRERLSDVPGVGLQPVADDVVMAPWLFSITIDPAAFGCSRDELMTRLDGQGIETRPFFIPVHTLPPYAAANVGVRLPHTDRLGACGLNLPTYSGMSDDQVLTVCAAVAEAAETARSA